MNTRNVLMIEHMGAGGKKTKRVDQPVEAEKQSQAKPEPDMDRMRPVLSLKKKPA